MTETNYMEEKNYIYKVAKVNGYEDKFVDKILDKHIRHQRTRQRTTLMTIREPKKVISLPFFPKITNTLSTVLHKFGIHVVTRNQNTMKDLLCNYKDQQKPLSTDIADDLVLSYSM